MYTAVVRIQFSPHWVDGSRSSAGHCCLWPWGAMESRVLNLAATERGRLPIGSDVNLRCLERRIATSVLLFF